MSSPHLKFRNRLLGDPQALVYWQLTIRLQPAEGPLGVAADLSA